MSEMRAREPEADRRVAERDCERTLPGVVARLQALARGLPATEEADTTAPVASEEDAPPVAAPAAASLGPTAAVETPLRSFAPPPPR